MNCCVIGTNNARVAQLLRHLASYYQKDSATIQIVRLSQGLLHMGKGTMTLNPYHMNRQLLCPPAIAALMTVMIAMTDVKTSTLFSRFSALADTVAVLTRVRRFCQRCSACNRT